MPLQIFLAVDKGVVKADLPDDGFGLADLDGDLDRGDAHQVGRGQRSDQRLPETAETDVVVLIAQRRAEER